MSDKPTTFEKAMAIIALACSLAAIVVSIKTNSIIRETMAIQAQNAIAIEGGK